MVLFKDMNKEVSDLFNKDFCTDKPFEVEHKFPCGNPQFTANASFSNGSMVKGMTMKFNNNTFFDEMKFSANGITSFEGKVQMPQDKKATMGFKYDQHMNKAYKECFEFFSEYNNKQFHGKANMSPFTKTFSASGMATFNYKGTFKFGGEMKGGFDKSSYSYASGVGYGNNAGNHSYFCSVKTNSSGMYPFGKFTVCMYGKTNTKHPSEFGAEFQKNMSEKNGTMQFGGQWYFGENNSSKFKAKMGTDMKAHAAMTHKFSNYVTATFGAQHDFANPNGAEATKYGMKFESSS